MRYLRIDEHDHRTAERFTARLTLVEQPRIVEQLERRAHRAGRTVSDEVRAALRAYLERQ
jgi:hypothetical protein